MTIKSKRWLIAAVMCCSIALLATGCDKLKKTETEAATEKVTEAPTEAPTESETETEAPTESETETEEPTESETESETQPQTMTLEEEQAQETTLDALKIVYAADDINVREQPDSSDSSNIFDSFDQGEEITVVGETPNWYRVEVEGYDIEGYVSKQFVSDTEVEAKTDDGDSSAEVSGTNDTAVSADNSSSSVDLEYNVESYAEQFTIRATAGANMRSTPSQDGEIINTIASDTEVTAIGYTDRWYKISYNGTIGYVNKNLFTAE